VILNSVPSAKSCSSSLNDSSDSESVMASPPPILDVQIFVDFPHMTEVPEVEAAEQEVVVITEAHAVSLKGWFSWFLQFHAPLSVVVVLALGVHEFMMMAVPKVTFISWLECCHHLSSQMMMNRSFNALNM
jgi:hypothetical protein